MVLVGNPRLAIGNLMGGVALQVVVLAVADVVESEQALMYQVTKPTVLFQHVALLVLLALATAGMAVGEPFAIGHVGLWPLLIVAAYLGSLALLRHHEGEPRWAITDEAPPLADDAEEPEAEHRPPLWRLAAFGLVILIAGWAAARSGDAIGDSPRLSGTFVGAALVAVTTSLPELSTVIGSLRVGAYDMAVANIMGTNGLEVALLALADVTYREGPVLAAATSADIFLASLAAVLTGLYLGALLLRDDRTVARVGYDSAAVIGIYAAGLVVLALIG